MSPTPEPSQATHLHYLKHALSLARLSPPKPTNFRVGCVIVSFFLPTSSESETPDLFHGEILSTGYTLELPRNTHAEQNALTKLARKNNTDIRDGSEDHSEDEDASLSHILTLEKNVYLYTSLEPCGLRLSGATPCVQRIISTRKDNSAGGVRKVIFGAKEPGTFVQDSQSLKTLDEAGVEWEYVEGMQDEILRVAKEGHNKKEADEDRAKEDRAQPSPRPTATNVDDISPAERARQEQQPRNTKKRMMEVDLSR